MVEVKVSEGVYMPAEDTFMVARHIPLNLAGKKVLDLGCGSGVLGIIAATNGADVTASDINPDAIIDTKKNAKRHNVKIKTVKSNLFKNIKGKFDLILFNPPYIPSDAHDIYISPSLRKALVSGKRGADIMKIFLKEFHKHLNKGGRVLLIISSLNKIKDSLEKKGWKEVDSAAFFFEKIYLMEYVQ